MLEVNQEVWIKGKIECITIYSETVYRVEIPEYNHVNQHDGQEYIYVDVSDKDIKPLTE